ncbi:MAG TPA: hypothetical protein VNX15_03275 [Gemmatimonadales bacterium]|jgi:hypothetical protein|nr:hypothetical protein [Gemmatimonadales bacterium]
MRKIHLLALSSLLLAAPATAQQSWDTEFGIQGGFSRFKLTGSPFGSSTIDVYSIPSSMIISVYPTTNAAFAIFPVGEKIAIEPGLSFLQQAGVGPGPVANLATLSLRADYAVTRQFYGALGLFGRYASGAGTLPAGYPQLQLGLEAAAGYRLHLGPRLNGRVEVQAVTVKKQGVAAPFNVYSVLFGLSTPLSERPAAAGRRGAAPAAPHGAWTLELGVSAGYTSVHLVGGPDVTMFSFPGAGSSSYAGLVTAPSAPSLFAIFPLNERLAAEVGVDAQNLRASTSTVASFQLAPRVDLAFGNRWYGALGPQFHFVKNTSNGTAITGVTGIAAAWGYRFHLSGALSGRVEASYGINAKRRHGSPLGGGAEPPTSAFGVNLGMMMPLK